MECRFYKRGIKVKSKEAIERWKEHDVKIKKKKEEETLDLQENKFNSEDEKIKNKERTLKSLKKKIVRNSNFSYLICNAGKGKKNRLRELEIEEGNGMVTV